MKIQSLLLFVDKFSVHTFFFLQGIINRPGEAGAVLQSPLSLIQSVTDPFPQNLQNILTP